MKTFGWICIVIGCISFMGAILKGDNVFGPVFWGALGLFLVYRANQKEKEFEEVEKWKNNNPTTQVIQSRTDTANPQYQSLQTKDEQEDLTSIHTYLATPQKEAAICLIAHFAGYNDDVIDNENIIALLKQAGVFFGVSVSPIELSQMMAKYQDADKLIDTVFTITHKKTKEFLLLSCYDLAKMSGKKEACDMLFNIADEMGYERERMKDLIRQYAQPPYWGI